MPGPAISSSSVAPSTFVVACTIVPRSVGQAMSPEGSSTAAPAAPPKREKRELPTAVTRIMPPLVGTQALPSASRRTAPLTAPGRLTLRTSRSGSTT